MVGFGRLTLREPKRHLLILHLPPQPAACLLGGGIFSFNLGFECAVTAFLPMPNCIAPGSLQKGEGQ